MGNILTILHKEWLELRREWWLLGSIGLLVGLLTGIPFAVLASPNVSGIDVNAFASNPLYSGMSAKEIVQAVLMRQFLLMYLMMPLYIPASIASYSIVGEKSRRTLEPLLATPVRTGQLLFAKCLAAAIPAIVCSWTSYAIYTFGTRAVALNDAVYQSVFTDAWQLAIALWVPLLTLIAVGLGVMISAMFNDPRAAQQMTGVVVVPVLIVFFAQLSGLLVVERALVLAAVVPLAVAAVAIMAAAIKVFNRETILTRWS